MEDRHQYAQLLADQDSNILEEDFHVPFTPEKNEVASIAQHQKKTARIRSILSIVAVCIVFLAAGIFIGASIPQFKKQAFMAHFQTHASTSYVKIEVVNGVETEGTQCGSTWEQAKEMGCKFDVMASRWYAPDCFFDEVLDEMMAEPWVNFTWYADEDHTEIFPSEKAMAGEFIHVYPDDCK